MPGVLPFWSRDLLARFRGTICSSGSGRRIVCCFMSGKGTLRVWLVWWRCIALSQSIRWPITPGSSPALSLHFPCWKPRTVLLKRISDARKVWTRCFPLEIPISIFDLIDSASCTARFLVTADVSCWRDRGCGSYRRRGWGLSTGGREGRRGRLGLDGRFGSRLVRCISWFRGLRRGEACCHSSLWSGWSGFCRGSLRIFGPNGLLLPINGPKNLGL